MIDRKSFFDHVRKAPFGGSLTTSASKGMTVILDTWERTGFSDARWLAYALATTFHETARTMQPIEEYGKGKGKAYGVPTGAWRNVYDGRGDVQLTWEPNYQKATAKLKERGFDIDLDRTPDDAMRPDVAAAILLYGMAEGWFTGKKLGDYFNSYTNDPVGARRIVNGTDKAVLIAGYYSNFLLAIGALAAVIATAPALPSPGLIVSTHVGVPAPAAPQGFWARFVAALTGRKAA